MSEIVSETPWFAVVTVAGQDALAFLQSQFAADLMALADGELRWSALLNPQGRVLQVVAVLRHDPSRFSLLVPFRRGLELQSMLQKFVFRRKLTLAVDDEARVCADPDGIACGLPDLHLRIGNATDTRVLGRNVVAACIAAGLALIDEHASGKHLAHALRLDRFLAFSVKKGCYPGQEIVARTHFLGRNKRVLVELSASDGSPLHSADMVYEDTAEIGEIACSSDSTALAVLRQLPAEHSRMHAGANRALVTIVATFADQP